MSGKTSTSTSGVSIPKEVLARYNAVNTQAQSVAQQPFTQYSQDPNAFVAPLNETQAAGINAVNANAGSPDPYFQGATQTLTGGAQAAMPLYEQATGLAGEGGQAVAPGELDIGKYQNPYIDSVVNSTLANQRQQQAEERQGLTSNAITSGAFGGDRVGLARANMAKQQNMATAQTEAGLRSEAFNTGLGAAQQQQGVSLAAEQANRAAKAAEAGQVQGIGKDIYSIGSGVSQGLAGLGAGQQQAALTGAQAQLSAGTAQQQTEQAGKSAMYNQFLQQQGYPFQTTQFLANIAEGTGALSGSNTSQTQPSSFFSDERLKEDIEPIGETYDGQKIYKYRYKGQEGKQIGLVAQDVERKHPDAVGSSQGFKTVDYDAATKDSASMGGGVTAGRAGQAFAAGGAAEDDGMAQVMAILTQHRQQYPYGNTGLYGIPDTEKYGPFKTVLDTTRRSGPKPEPAERHPLNYVINLPDIKDNAQYARGGRAGLATGGSASDDYFERVLAMQRAMYGNSEPKGGVSYSIPQSAPPQRQLLRPERIEDPSRTTGSDISSAASTGKNIADLWSLGKAFFADGGVAGRGRFADGGVPDSWVGPRLPDDRLTDAELAAQNEARIAGFDAGNRLPRELRNPGVNVPVPAADQAAAAIAQSTSLPGYARVTPNGILRPSSQVTPGIGGGAQPVSFSTQAKRPPGTGLLAPGAWGAATANGDIARRPDADAETRTRLNIGLDAANAGVEWGMRKVWNGAKGVYEWVNGVPPSFVDTLSPDTPVHPGPRREPRAFNDTFLPEGGEPVVLTDEQKAGMADIAAQRAADNAGPLDAQFRAQQDAVAQNNVGYAPRTDATPSPAVTVPGGLGGAATPGGATPTAVTGGVAPAVDTDMTQAVAAGAPTAQPGSPAPVATVPPPVAPSVASGASSGSGSAPAGLKPLNVSVESPTAQAQGLAAAARAKANEPPPPPPKMSMESWLVPLLSGLGAMASSPSRYLGAAILQGAAGAATGYETVQKNITDRSKTMSDIAQNAQNSDMGTVIAYGKDGQAVMLRQDQYFAAPKGTYSLTPPGSRGAGAAAVAAPQVTAAAQPSAAAAVPGAAPAAEGAAPTAGAAAAAAAVPPMASLRALSSDTEKLIDADIDEMLKQPAAYTRPQVFDTPTHTAALTAAAADGRAASFVRGPTMNLLAALDAEPIGGSLAENLAPAAKMASSLLDALGVPHSVLSSPHDLTKYQEEIQKATAQLGTGEVAKSVEALVTKLGSMPSGATSKAALPILGASVQVNMQRLLDKQQFAALWQQRAAAKNSGLAQYSGQRMDTEFDRVYAARYAKEQEELAKMYGGHIAGQPAIDYLTKNAAKLSPGLKQFVITTYGGGDEDFLRYFGVK